jgi:hypothetical protein
MLFAEETAAGQPAFGGDPVEDIAVDRFEIRR